jgi:hypothetical protein
MSNEKYINITKDNVRERLLDGKEYEFCDYPGFEDSYIGKLCGFRSTGSYPFLTDDENFKYCRTKNPNYKEQKDINKMIDGGMLGSNLPYILKEIVKRLPKE